MKVGTIVTATDTNPLYMDFIPIFVKAWKSLIPEADVRIVLVADGIPEQFQEFSRNIVLFPPIPGIHTAFQAQCIRLLYPRDVERDEGVLITDMDMLPMNRSFYVNSISTVSSDAFVVYRDVCLPSEISMCYNIAHPAVWKSMFGEKSTTETLVEWHSPVVYDGQHGGVGWNTDQLILVKCFNAWNGMKVVLNDKLTEFRRLDRVLPYQFQDKESLRGLIKSGFYADYHCLRPYRDNKEMNDFIVECLSDKISAFSFCLYGPENKMYYKGLLENIELIKTHYPGWKVFVYHAPDVTNEILNALRKMSNVILKETHVTGPVNMVHRFFAIDEPGVEVMMVRDADSRIHWKDRWAIQDFLQKTEYVAHTIRDNVVHNAPIMGGLWGLRKSSGLNIRQMYEQFKDGSFLDQPKGHDQYFLMQCIYPAVVSKLLVHYSNGRLFQEEHGVEFPFAWSSDLFCGQDVQYEEKNLLAGTVVNFLHKK